MQNKCKLELRITAPKNAESCYSLNKDTLLVVGNVFLSLAYWNREVWIGGGGSKHTIPILAKLLDQSCKILLSDSFK